MKELEDKIQSLTLNLNVKTVVSYWSPVVIELLTPTIANLPDSQQQVVEVWGGLVPYLMNVLLNFVGLGIKGPG